MGHKLSAAQLHTEYCYCYFNLCKHLLLLREKGPQHFKMNRNDRKTSTQNYKKTK